MKFTSPAPKTGDPEVFTLVAHHKVTEEHYPPAEGEETPQPVFRDGWEPRDHTFSAVPDVSGTALVRVDLSAQRGQHAESVQEMFAAALTPESYAEWRKLMDDPDVFIASETLSDIGQWLYDRSARFPTRRS